MSSELPIACSLSATELSQRRGEMSSIGQTSMLGAEIDGTRAVLRFRAGSREQLAAIVAAEAECCAFLKMTLDDRPDVVELTIQTPAGAETALEDLVAAFSSTGQAA
jgi:hypothetical protein